MNGIINIYKEKGFTSHDVVAKLRGILRMKKIGHTGTLDPDAEGVLPVCLGSGTKLCDYITDKSKVYEAVVKLGVVTDTQDLSGTVLESSEVKVGIDEVKEAFLSFIGEYDQVPPMYSAVKVNGKKLYELARQGMEIERAARRVIVHNIEILEDNLAENEVKIRVFCGKGTYIRTLIHDAGQKLSCGASMKSLLRTKVGTFTVEDALTLQEIEVLRDKEELKQHVVAVDEVFHDCAALQVIKEADKLLQNGNTLKETDFSNQVIPEVNTLYRVYTSEEQFAGIYYYEPSRKIFKPEKMFLS